MEGGKLRAEAGEMAMRWDGQELRVPARSLGCILSTMEEHWRVFGGGMA